jgi:hypothetical protein
VLRIRIHRIRMFLGLQGPNPSLFVRIRIFPSSRKKVIKALISTFVTSLWLFFFEDVNVSLKSKKQKNFTSRKPLTKRAGFGSVPNTLSRIHNTGSHNISHFCQNIISVWKMCRMWAVCVCSYESNIYLAGVGHVTFKNPEQFVKDYASKIGPKGLQNAIGGYLFFFTSTGTSL